MNGPCCGNCKLCFADEDARFCDSPDSVNAGDFVEDTDYCSCWLPKDEDEEDGGRDE